MVRGKWKKRRGALGFFFGGEGRPLKPVTHKERADLHYVLVQLPSCGRGHLLTPQARLNPWVVDVPKMWMRQGAEKRPTWGGSLVRGLPPGGGGGDLGVRHVASG